MAQRNDLSQNNNEQELYNEKTFNEPEEPITLTGITEMTQKQREDLVLAIDGYLYFQSVLEENQITESPMTRQSFEGTEMYPTYAVQKIIEYAALLKKENDKLTLAIKELKDDHAISLHKLNLLEHQRNIDVARIKDLEEINTSHSLNPRNKKRKRTKPEENIVSLKNNPMALFKPVTTPHEKKPKLSDTEPKPIR